MLKIDEIESEIPIPPQIETINENNIDKVDENLNDSTELQSIVIDNGSGYIKAGFSGNNFHSKFLIFFF
jgi:hypothetical protein